MNEYSASERRLALLVLLHRMAPTISQIAQTPAYTNVAADNLERYIERDLASLRESGYEITVDRDYRYHLQNSGIEIQGSDLELGILHSLLGARTDGLKTAQSGITKLLSQGQASVRGGYLKVRIPSGAAALEIAPAIEHRKQIRFEYHASGRSLPRTYTVEPLALEVHFDVFYLRGYQIGKDEADSGYRHYKLDRVTGPVTVLATDITHAAPASLGVFATVSAEVEVNPQLPAPNATAVDRNDLFDDLMFYGLDAKLVGPDELRDDFKAALGHLASLGPRDE